MVSIINAVIVLLVIIIGHSFVSALMMLHIRLEAKKKWNKNVKYYPYFTYPIYKKIFLLGLKNALNKFIVILTFILNITIMLLIACCIWIAIEPNLIISYVHRAIIGVTWLAFLLRLFCYWAAPVNFQ